MAITLARPPAEVPSSARRRAWRTPSPWLALAVAAVVLAALAIALPVDHDEGQYVAAAALARRLVPYADFAYLQTPLQLYLAAPLASVARGWAFVALRLANAAMGLGELALVYAVQRRLGVGRGRALAAAGLLLAAYPFEFSSAVARNDALPALLESAAMLAGIEALRMRRAAWALWTLAGLLLGLAASAKLSYVFPPSATGLFLLWSVWRGRIGLPSLIGFGLGGLTGLLPCLLAWLRAPEGFLWGAVTFAETAPGDWFGRIGQGHRLWLPVRAAEGAFHLGVGPALAVVVGVGLALVRLGGKDAAGPAVVFVRALALAGLAAAFAPSPMQRQYLAPLLPPLFVLWGVLDPPARLPGAARATTRLLLAAGIAVGLGRAGYVLGHAAIGWIAGRPPPALALTAEAHWLGRTLVRLGVRGPVATISPQLEPDSGVPLDPRFASGVFAYRTGDLVSDAQQRRLRILSPRTLAAGLDTDPPGALVTGLETPQGVGRRNPDDDLRAYARTHGYDRRLSPDGAVELWVRGPSAASPVGRSPSPRPRS